MKIPKESHNAYTLLKVHVDRARARYSQGTLSPAQISALDSLSIQLLGHEMIWDRSQTIQRSQRRKEAARNICLKKESA